MTTVTPPETETVILPDTEEKDVKAFPWSVILFNDDVHSFDEVILQVSKATACSYTRAAEITLEAHTKGQAICFTGELEGCKRVARILEEIHLLTEIIQADPA